MGHVEKASTTKSMTHRQVPAGQVAINAFVPGSSFKGLLRSLALEQKNNEQPNIQLGRHMPDHDELAFNAINWLLYKQARSSGDVDTPVEFEDFDDALKVVNPLLARSAERLGKAVLSRALNLAELEALADRIDRTQAESRAIIDSLFV